MTVSFDKKLAELDAYLQMLIEQNESLDEKLKQASSEAERDGLILIKNNLESLLGSIKHAIVLLQIAKVSIRTQPSATSFSSLSSASTPDSCSKSFTSSGTTAISFQAEQSSQASPKPPARASKARNAQQQSSQQRHSQTEQHQTAPTSSMLTSPSSNQQQNHQFEPVQNEKPIECNENVNVSSEGGGNSTAEVSPRGSHYQSPKAAQETTKYCAVSSLVRDGATVGAEDLDDDDDDAFYDAAENQHNQPQQQTNGTSNLTSNEFTSLNSNNTNSSRPNYTNFDSTTTAEAKMSESSNKELAEDGSNIDWDSLYDEEEEDLGSLENQGSVIKHLMSQIRIGMDLTKVVLPTFILERRSLLEMYADFFAHPDLFSEIPNYKTPEERMIQVVKWYLSAFHAGRKSSVAKKPYNPILGEIFLCHWDLSNNINDNSVSSKIERTSSTESSSSLSDIEKFSKQLPHNSLLFVAEQVSHHPPVSAFYAENPEKSISCCAHIYTKSKYLGLSVGVHNIGEGVIKLLKHNETYVCTFPSAYGRSILTVPWVELGGSVDITCEQTGYAAKIEFITKPFYGGKKHRVMGQIMRPNKEPFMTIDGEWNGCMYYKAPPNSNDKQVFVDTACLPVIKKQIRSISSQESFESRNVWKEVTRALKLRDVINATTAKSFIEQRQRDLLKDRMEKGIKWKTRYFEAVDDGWTFSRPLAVPQSAEEAEDNK